MEKPKLQSLDHLVLTVRNIAATRDFYCVVLGMTHSRFAATDGGIRDALAFGHQKINLHTRDTEITPRAQHPVPGSADLCFLTETPLEIWQDHLTFKGIDIESGPIARTGATGPILSIYLRDPDGNLIEIATPSDPVLPVKPA